MLSGALSELISSPSFNGSERRNSHGSQDFVTGGGILTFKGWHLYFDSATTGHTIYVMQASGCMPGYMKYTCYPWIPTSHAVLWRKRSILDCTCSTRENRTVWSPSCHLISGDSMADPCSHWTSSLCYKVTPSASLCPHLFLPQFSILQDPAQGCIFHETF